MEGIYGVQLIVVLYLGMSVGWAWCQDNDANVTSVYIVTLKQAPTGHYIGELIVKHDRKVNRLDKPLARYNCFFFFEKKIKNSILPNLWLNALLFTT